MSLFSCGMTTNCCFSVTGTCTRVWTSNRSSLTVRYAIKRGKSRTAEVTWTMGGKLLRLLFLLSATVALLCSLASAEQGKSIDNIRTCFGLWRLWCVDCAFCFSFRISYVPRSVYIYIYSICVSASSFRYRPYSCPTLSRCRMFSSPYFCATWWH